MKPRLLLLHFFALVLFTACTTNAVVAATITSVGTGNWSATAWPNTLRSGTITTSTASATVVGSGTTFTTQISVGNILKTTGNVAIGTVLSVNSNTSITLTANASSSNSAITYNNQGVGAGDAVMILGGTTMTIDNAVAACTSLSSATTGAASPWGLVFNAGSHLTVGGTLTVGGASRAGSITMTSGGTLTSKALAVTNAGTWLPGAGTVELNAANTLPATFFTSFNNLIISNGNTNTGVAITINGNLSIANGASTSFTVAGFGLTVAGTTTIGGGTSGSLLFSSATGTKVFDGLVTISTGAFWTNTANGNIQFKGGISNSGTFTAGSGTQTFNTNDQSITGTFTIPSVTITGVTLTNTGTLTISAALAGAGTLSQGTSATLNINFTGLPSISNLIANSVDNIVNYGFAGTQTVFPANYFILTLSNSGVKTLETGTTAIDGDFTLNGTASTTSVTGLTIGGDVSTDAGTTWNAGAFTHNLGGNFSNGGVFNPGTGTIVFDGADLQAISNAGTAGFTNLTVNNSAAGIQFENPMTIGSSLVLSQGNIDLNGNMLTLGSSGTTVGTLTRTTGTIIDQAGGGSFVRWFGTATVADGDAAGLFPVGTSISYNPFNISAPVDAPSAGGTVSAAYTDASSNTAVNIPDAGFTIVVRKDLFWTLSASNGLAGGTYDLNASGTNFGTVGAVSDLRLSLINSVVGTAGVNGGTLTDPQVNRTAVSLSDLSNSFFIASTNASSSPLPITLISFRATPLYGKVELDWETSSEVNNDHFTIQRSVNTSNWENIAQIAGAGNNSADEKYTAYDEDPYQGVSYYRLQQTDRDGKSTLSKTISVNYTQASPLTIYPNPATDFIDITTAKSGKLDITLYNIAGQQIIIPMSTGNNNVRLNVSGLPAGIYLVNIIQNTVIVTKTILKI
jgi:hypothetical protein